MLSKAIIKTNKSQLLGKFYFNRPMTMLSRLSHLRKSKNIFQSRPMEPHWSTVYGEAKTQAQTICLILEAHKFSFYVHQFWPFCNIQRSFFFMLVQCVHCTLNSIDFNDFECYESSSTIVSNIFGHCNRVKRQAILRWLTQQQVVTTFWFLSCKQSSKLAQLLCWLDLWNWFPTTLSTLLFLAISI